MFAPGLTGPGDGRRCCGLVSRLGSIEKTCLCRVLCLVPCPNRVQTVSICRLPYIPVHRILSFSKKLFNRILSNRFISDCCFLLPFSPSAHYPPLSFQCIPSVHNNRKASHVGLSGPLILCVDIHHSYPTSSCHQGALLPLGTSPKPSAELSGSAPARRSRCQPGDAEGRRSSWINC